MHSCERNASSGKIFHGLKGSDLLARCSIPSLVSNTAVARYTQPYVTTRDIVLDKWDSCRAIDCPRRTDRLALMCFVDLPRPDFTRMYRDIEDRWCSTLLGRARRDFRRARHIVREIRRSEISPRTLRLSNTVS